MRKFVLVLVLCAALLAGIMVAFAGNNKLTAPYGFSINSATVTSMVVSASDSNGVAFDSLQVISYPDSTRLALLYHSTSPDTTLYNLTPGTRYILGLRGVRNDSVVVSNKDTLYTNRVEIEKVASVGRNTSALGARSDRALSVQHDSLYVSTASGLDSTMVFWSAPYMAVQAYVSGHADSSKVKLLLFAGAAQETNTAQDGVSTQTGEWVFPFAAVDSVQLTEPGWNPVWNAVLPPSEHFYIRADGQTDNGNATKVILRFMRRWVGDE